MSRCPNNPTSKGRSLYVLLLVVLPINHILGRVPLMKVFLCGSSSQTILSALSQQKQAYFRFGHADQNGNEGSRSKLYMLNVHLWQFGGPQQRTISVEEPRENNKQAKKAAYQNSAQRQPPGEHDYLVNPCRDPQAPPRYLRQGLVLPPPSLPTEPDCAVHDGAQHCCPYRPCLAVAPSLPNRPGSPFSGPRRA